MTVIFEVSRPFVGPFRYKSRTIYRFGLAWFAVAFLRIPFDEFARTAFDWRLTGWGNQ